MEIGPRVLLTGSLDDFCRDGPRTDSGRDNHYRKAQRNDAEPEAGGKRDDHNGGGGISAAGSGSDCFA